MTISTGNLTALFALVLLLLGLSFTVTVDPYISRKHRTVMLIIIALSATLIAQNLLEEYSKGQAQWFWRTTMAICGYTIRPIILILFLYILQPEKKHLLAWGLAVINWAIHMTAYFSHLCFWISSNNMFFRGPLTYTCLYISLVLLADMMVESVRSYRKGGKREKLIPIFIVIMILLSVYLDGKVESGEQPVTFLTVAIVASSMFYYIWLHLQFVREHEDDLKAQSRIQIMMTQIQPHFLFNTLNTIRALYAKDPPLADRTLENFSAYLRQNLEALNQSELIPVSRELEHTRLYAEIEKQRFPNIRVDYRIEDEDFQIPTLTIQPLVENAIRHGVRSRKDGLVTVSTVSEAGVHRITVQDNGVGFDIHKQDSKEESHIGIQNVKNRIAQMCGGTMLLESEIGKGTSVTLLLPDETGKKQKEKRK